MPTAPPSLFVKRHKHETSKEKTGLLGQTYCSASWGDHGVREQADVLIIQGLHS